MWLPAARTGLPVAIATKLELRCARRLVQRVHSLIDILIARGTRGSTAKLSSSDDTHR